MKIVSKVNLVYIIGLQVQHDLTMFVLRFLTSLTLVKFPSTIAPTGSASLLNGPLHSS